LDIVTQALTQFCNGPNNPTSDARHAVGIGLNRPRHHNMQSKDTWAGRGNFDSGRLDLPRRHLDVAFRPLIVSFWSLVLAGVLADDGCLWRRKSGRNRDADTAGNIKQ